MATGGNVPNRPNEPSPAGAPAAGAPHGAWPYTSQRLAEQIVAHGVLPAASVSDLIAHASSRGISLVDAALERGVLQPEVLRDAMSRIFEIPVADLSEYDESALAAFPRDLAQTHLVVPLEKVDDHLVLVVADPTRSRTMREVRAAVGMPLELRLATKHDLTAIIHSALAPRLSAKFSNGIKVDFVVPPTGAKIGRADTNDLILRDPSVSHVHAIIQPTEDGRFQIVDFGSRNGVVVNRKRIRGAHLLANKDKIQIGKVQLKYKEPKLEAAEAEAPKKTFLGFPMEARLQAAWIAFWSRIIAQALGAAALIFLGLAISGGLPTGCSPFGS